MKTRRPKPAAVAPALLRLDLACGQHKQPGFVGVDRVALEGVDQVVDLEAYPWPWPDASVEAVHCSHFIEHVTDFCAFMNELWRVMIPGGTALIIAPYYTSMRAWQDPTHKRAISEASFLYANKVVAHESGAGSLPDHVRLGFRVWIRPRARIDDAEPRISGLCHQISVECRAGSARHPDEAVAMASPAFQEDAYQNLTAHGTKGFQVTDSDTGAADGGGVRTDPSSLPRPRPAARAVARRAELDMSPSPPDGLVENLRRLDPQLRLRWGRHQHKWIIEVKAQERLPQREQERPSPIGTSPRALDWWEGWNSSPSYLYVTALPQPCPFPWEFIAAAPEASLPRGASRQGRAPRALRCRRAGGGDGREAEMGRRQRGGGQAAL